MNKAQIKLSLHPDITGKFISGSAALILKHPNGQVVVIPQDWLTGAVKERPAFPAMAPEAGQ